MMTLVSERLLNLISESDIFIITSRFHLMIFAIILNTPPIVISWSSKYSDILMRYGKKNCVLMTLMN